MNNRLNNFLLLPLALVASATSLLYFFSSFLEKAHFGLFYLLIVTAAARIGDTRSAVLTAVLSFLSWNFFFLQPYYTFVIHDPRDWFMLFTFLAIGTFVGKITGQMRSREQDAISREKEIETLYRASLAINSYVDMSDAKNVILEQITDRVEVSGCAVLVLAENEPAEDLVIDISSGEPPDPADENLKKIALWAIKNAKSVGLRRPDWPEDRNNPVIPISVDYEEIIPGAKSRNDIFIPLLSKDVALGLLYVSRMSPCRMDYSSCRFLAAFSGILGILLERQRLMAGMVQAGALQESEHLKSVLLSSISHNLKNPLVSLKATLSSLLQEDVEWKPGTVMEHLTCASEEVERLNRNIESLLSISRLESGTWKPRKDWSDIREIAGREISLFPEKDRVRVRLEAPEDFPMVFVDPIQISQVIRHLVENALRFSPKEEPVLIGVDWDSQHVKFHVEDRGPGVPEKDRETVFNLFYTGSSTGEGTGLGLAICREIVEAHQGRIWVDSSPGGGAGFFVEIPREHSAGKEAVK